MKLSVLFCVVALSSALLSACQKPQQAAAAKRPPPQVSVQTAHSGTVDLQRELVGRLASTRVAQVRARVAGVILQRAYTEGSDVKQGQVLFRIDPAPLTATLHARQAALAQAQANAANAVQNAKRSKELAAKNLVAPQVLDDALANERSTAAAVKQAQANLESAQLNLDYATVTAPIAGRAGKALVTEGALVGEGEATLLTTVESIDPIYVNFSQPAAQYADLERLRSSGQAVQLQLTLPDGSGYDHKGTLDFVDRAVNPDTGAVSLRGLFPNPQQRLLPGMFVKVNMRVGRLENAFRLPQQALLRDSKGAYALVLNGEDNVVEKRVEVAGMTQQDWVVSTGLSDGDRVIVSGLQKVRPGAQARSADQAPQATSAH